MHTYTFIVFVLLVHSIFKYDVDVHIQITQEKSYDVTLKSGGIFEKKKKKIKKYKQHFLRCKVDGNLRDEFFNICYASPFVKRFLIRVV